VGFYEHSNESLGSIKDREFFASRATVGFQGFISVVLVLTQTENIPIPNSQCKLCFNSHCIQVFLTVPCAHCNSWAMGWTTEESVFSSQQRGLPNLLFNGYQGSLPCRQSDHVLKLTTHLHRVLRLRIMKQ
jgi:hypothetical protein